MSLLLEMNAMNAILSTQELSFELLLLETIRIKIDRIFLVDNALKMNGKWTDCCSYEFKT